MTEETSAKRGPGRPRKYDEAMIGTTARMTKTELDRARLAAALCDMDLSEYIRHAVIVANNAHLPAGQ